MEFEEIKPGVYYVGAPDAQRRLFDALIPLPDGTSYNAFLVKGQNKAALIDTVDPTKEKVLLNNLQLARVKKIDYIIAQHCEQDHSGSLPAVLALYPQAKIVTNAKCQAMLMDHVHLPAEKFLIIEDNQTLDLGGKTLRFIFTPWVHWPETMSTYLAENKILFSCDWFAAHLGRGGLWAKEDQHYYNAIKRYFAEIMMPFRTPIKNNLEKISGLTIEIIAPSHGPLYSRPDFVVQPYQEWIADQVKNEVVLAYVTMHGSTAVMADYLAQALKKQGVTVKLFNLAQMDLGEFAMALVDAATVLIGTPTVLTGPHPLALNAVFLFNALRPRTRLLSIFGSYGWGGKAVDQLTGLLAGFRGEVLEPIMIKGLPGQADLVKLNQLADAIYGKHKEAKLL